jgi:hypothetical protein
MDYNSVTFSSSNWLFSALEKVLLTVIYSLCLSWLYSEIVHPLYDYQGFVLFEPSFFAQVAAVALSAMLSTALPDRINEPSELFGWLFFLIVVVPTVTLTQLVIDEPSTALFWTAHLAMACFIVLLRLLSGHRLFLPSPLNPRFPFNYVLALAAFGAVSLLAVLYQAELSSLTSIAHVRDLYGIREGYREKNASLPFYGPYLLNWAAKILVPLLLLFALREKRWWLVTAAVLLQLVLFSVSGHKSFLLGLFLLIGVYVLLQFVNSGLWMLRFTVAVTFAGTVWSFFMGNNMLVEVLLRRALLVPGMLTNFYYEYFTLNGSAMFAHNFLSKWVAPEYQQVPAFEIGLHYLKTEGAAANANFWADAYANLGLWGLLFANIWMLLLLLVCNALMEGRARLTVMPAFAIPFWSMIETAYSTALITHGFFLALILVYLLPARTKGMAKLRN